MRHIVQFIPRTAVLQFSARYADVLDQPCRPFDRIYKPRSKRGVATGATYNSTKGPLSLVTNHHSHVGRFADKAAERFVDAPSERLQQRPHANAAHLLVMRNREVYRDFEPSGRHLRRHREANGKETLHIGHAAADIAAACLR